MALAGALQVNTMLEELDLGETDLVSTCTFSGGEVVLYECLAVSYTHPDAADE